MNSETTQENGEPMPGPKTECEHGAAMPNPAEVKARTEGQHYDVSPAPKKRAVCGNCGGPIYAIGKNWNHRNELPRCRRLKPPVELCAHVNVTALANGCFCDSCEAEMEIPEPGVVPYWRPKTPAPLVSGFDDPSLPLKAPGIPGQMEEARALNRLDQPIPGISCNCAFDEGHEPHCRVVIAHLWRKDHPFGPPRGRCVGCNGEVFEQMPGEWLHRSAHFFDHVATPVEGSVHFGQDAEDAFALVAAELARQGGPEDFGGSDFPDTPNAKTGVGFATISEAETKNLLEGEFCMTHRRPALVCLGGAGGILMPCRCVPWDGINPPVADPATEPQFIANEAGILVPNPEYAKAGLVGITFHSGAVERRVMLERPICRECGNIEAACVCERFAPQYFGVVAPEELAAGPANPDYAAPVVPEEPITGQSLLDLAEKMTVDQVVHHSRSLYPPAMGEIFERAPKTCGYSHAGAVCGQKAVLTTGRFSACALHETAFAAGTARDFQIYRMDFEHLTPVKGAEIAENPDLHKFANFTGVPQGENYNLAPAWLDREESDLGTHQRSFDEATGYTRELHRDPDAFHWAQYYLRAIAEIKRRKPGATPELELDYMHGFFANAMMAMHDFQAGKFSKKLQEVDARRPGPIWVAVGFVLIFAIVVVAVVAVGYYVKLYNSLP